MQLADELDPKKIAGNIIVIRLMNRTGFEHRTMSLTYEDGKNLNRVSLEIRMVHSVTESPIRL